MDRRANWPNRPRFYVLDAILTLLVIVSNGAEEFIMVEKVQPRITLAPTAPWKLDPPVGIGHAQLVRFSCFGGPADAIITFKSYSQHADPLIYLSLHDPDDHKERTPTMSTHDLSTFDQWQEDRIGVHHLVVKGVSASGGILALLNLQHFAREELNGVLSIRCNFIIAFDAFFWDFLRDENVCPSGQYEGDVPNEKNKCSGHGHCDNGVVCKCASGWVGQACEHRIHDLVAAGQNHFNLDLASGHYRYFRIRIPPSFRGGYVEVDVAADAPLVVLINGPEKRSLPSKSNFDLSNFDGWLSRNTSTRLRFHVKHSVDLPDERRLSVRPSRLSRSPEMVNCPRAVDGGWQGQACHTDQASSCQHSCAYCMFCNKSAEVNDPCAKMCKHCLSHRCIDVLSECAASVGCMNYTARECELKCTNCMVCMDSNDPACNKCKCCERCFPLAAKCGLFSSAFDSVGYVHVAIFNHRRICVGACGDTRPNIRGVVDLSLLEEPGYRKNPQSWIGDLYDSFTNVQDIERTQRMKYPDGEQFLYVIDLGALGAKSSLKKEVSLFRDRVTLIHILNPHNSADVRLSFPALPKISHVLSSSKAAPKTFFDFEEVARLSLDGDVRIDTIGRPDVWCALFAGKQDGSIYVTVSSYSPANTASPWVFTLLCILTVICALIVCGSLYSGAKKPTQSLSSGQGDERVPVSERLAGLLLPTRTTSTSERNQGHSLQGYMSQDFMDPTIEEQYLFRGGFGDDGM